MLIPEKEQQNLIDVFWPILIHATNHVKEDDILHKRDVEDAFKLLNKIGLTTGKPYWFTDDKWNEFLNK